MKVKNLLKTGLVALLALALEGCPKTDFIKDGRISAKRHLSDYILTEDDMRREYDTTVLTDCFVDNTAVYYIIDIKKVVLTKTYECYLSEEPKSNDRYVVSAIDFFIITNGIKNGEINKEGPFCVETVSYISARELNDGKILYLINQDRDGDFDYALREDYPEEEIPKPIEKDEEC